MEILNVKYALLVNDICLEPMIRAFRVACPVKLGVRLVEARFEHLEETARPGCDLVAIRIYHPGALNLLYRPLVICARNVKPFAEYLALACTVNVRNVLRPIPFTHRVKHVAFKSSFRFSYKPSGTIRKLYDSLEDKVVRNMRLTAPNRTVEYVPPRIRV